MTKGLATDERIDLAVMEVERELAVRPRVYRSQMEKGNLARVDAENQYNRMKWALAFLKLVLELKQSLPGYVARQSEMGEKPPF